MTSQSTAVIADARLYRHCFMSARLHELYLIGAERSFKTFEREHGLEDIAGSYHPAKAS